ncbi:MAG TPA: hypothetical protein VGO21_02825 [Candidatus Paceibacterota bacterium]|nr:hypothetical protein [Candidatus Paceibacterota bacterium]
MKRMLKTVGLSLVMACVVTLAWAQNNQMPSDQMLSPDARASKMTEWMKTNLNLTGDQVNKVQDINMKYSMRMDSLKKSIGDVSDRSVGVKSESDARDAELKGVLTDQQYKTYLDKKKELKEKYKEKTEGGQ